MMRIFYIDWQQHWKYDWTMNIDANAHGKQAVLTKKQPHMKRLETSVDSWASSDFGEVWSWFYQSLDCFAMRLFHSPTIFCCCTCTCICCLKLHRLITRLEGVFFFKLNLVGGTQLQCIYYLCCILIPRLPRVFRRFKRCSCSYCEQKYYISECCSISVNGMHNFLVFLPDVWVTPIKMSE